MNRRRLVASAIAAITALSAAAPVAADGKDDDRPRWRVTTVADGLDNPRDVDIAGRHRVFVAETGAGRVLSIWRSGRTRTLVGGFPVVTSDEGASGVHAVAALGGNRSLILVGEGSNEPDEDSDFNTLKRFAGGSLTQIADIGAYQAVDVDLQDRDDPPFPAQANPYGIANLPGGRALVADAGGNDLLLVRPSGAVRTVARFAPFDVSTDHLPFPFPFPELNAEVVPTAVVVGRDGWWYVATLSGFPFRPGTAKIFRIAPWARNAVCTAGVRTGACREWATGFTMIVAMDVGPDGDFYVVEFAENGPFSDDPQGALLRVDRRTKRVRELVNGRLTLPGGVAVDHHGSIWVTNNSTSATDGELLLIRRVHSDD